MPYKDSNSGISFRDQSLINMVVEELRSNGVLEKTTQFEGLSEEEFDVVLQDAIDASLTEKELNPDYYDEELDESFRNSHYDIADPSEGGFYDE